MLTKNIELFKIGDEYHLFNCLNSAIITMDKSTANKIKKSLKSNVLTMFSSEEVKLLENEGFLIEKMFDKNQPMAKRQNYLLSKHLLNKSRLKIEFALTNKCNFACPYCFEKSQINQKETANKALKKDTVDKLVRYIENSLNADVELLELVYFGGEPSLEKEIILNLNKTLAQLCVGKKIKFEYLLITNGFLLDADFIKKIKPNECRFVQTTLDGEKECHNQRRTNRNKINTFDVIVQNVNTLIENKIKTVIRLNVDKENVASIKKLLEAFWNIFDIKNKEFISIDIARVFGSDISYSLSEYEKIRACLLQLAFEKEIYKPSLSGAKLSAFCIAETLGKDISLDIYGDIYQCWDNIFDESKKVSTLNAFLAGNNTRETLALFEDVSLVNINNGKCFNCKYSDFCHGLCPQVRRRILHKEEENIYEHNKCKKIIRNRIKNEIKLVAKENKITTN